MSSREQQPGSGAPRQQIEEAYHQCLEARKRYVRIKHDPTKNAGEGAHIMLQSAVMEYYEALFPLLSTQGGEIEQYWENAPLWRTVSGSVDEEIEVGWVKGLKQLQDYYHQETKTTTQVSGFLGEEIERTRRQTQLLDVPVLMRIARYLDQCLEEMDLHVEVRTEMVADI